MNRYVAQAVGHSLPGDLTLRLVHLDRYARSSPLQGVSEHVRARAARMASSRDGRRLVASRHVLRRMLGEHLGEPPETLSITRDGRGKPSLAGRSLDFNLSRSGPLALIGIARGLSVGVDVETIRPVPEAKALVEEHFSERERREWSTSPGPPERAFLACWTRKEACAKASGVGMRSELRALDVGCREETLAVRLCDDLGRQRFTVTSLDLGPGAVGAAAVTSLPGWGDPRPANLVPSPS